ncbi:uncharacterized protein LOC114579773 [Dendrobium catenatum]|uniref:uncharacterized protein LOC114579773 n=1 Tax=Dendrobium catenatum TaxID=906689 RepID=UPI00109FEACF|nr:uncharacterized protein LOC114579773 [Dendrobium catenatum]
MVLAGDAVLVHDKMVKDMEKENGKGVPLWAEKSEPNATNDNTGEVRRELPIVVEPRGSSINASLDSFTQMMAAITKMIKNAQTQAEGSGGTVMDKNLKLFQYMKPPSFVGGEAIEAEDWLMKVEKILEGMLCPQDRRVALAAYAFNGEAERWWKSQLEGTFGGRPSNQITWEEFVKVFRDWYASHLIPNAEEKCHRFLCGLRDSIRQPLVPLGIEDYSTLVDRARKVELDYQSTQRRRDFQKRKNSEEDIQSNQTEGSNGKKPKFSSSGGSGATVSKVTEPCAKCGRLHKGECLIGSNTCYWCHQPGHIAKYCPALTQKTSGGMRSIEAPSQRNYEKSKMIEPSVAGSMQNQSRQNVRPRVYSLTQQEPDGSLDADNDN